MGSRYSRNGSRSETRFAGAPFSPVNFSNLSADPRVITAFNAGELVPVFCCEVLPHSTFRINLDFVLRQTTLLTPTMGTMKVAFDAYFVPNRVVNNSWRNVIGYNSNGEWIPPSVDLVSLYDGSLPVQIPVGSVADYYGYPTQQPIPAVHLNQCHDLKIRGYLAVWNYYYRDQNYQPPVRFSRLNVNNGFLLPLGSYVGFDGENTGNIYMATGTDGKVGANAIALAVLGEGDGLKDVDGGTYAMTLPRRKTSFSALSSPLKVNKFHDYFTSVLPSPQKGIAPLVPLSGSVPVDFDFDDTRKWRSSTGFMRLLSLFEPVGGSGQWSAMYKNVDSSASNFQQVAMGNPSSVALSSNSDVNGMNLVGNVNLSNAGFSINDLRYSAAVQRVYELLARGGSRYEEFLNIMFGLQLNDALKEEPVHLGRVIRDLELYQTAQTSNSVVGSTPQGNLAGFGYTSSGGSFKTFTAPEHGYIHIFVSVRQENMYPSYMGADNFRRTMLDFYQPTLDNISEQPVYTREINPFYEDSQGRLGVFGFQEAWASYRFEPSRVTGAMRPGIPQSLALWHYADEFSSDLLVADGLWLQSNAREVLDRTLAITSANAPQLKLDMKVNIEKNLPMSVYSVPGQDII